MKTIRIQNKYHRQLELLVKVSGTRQSKVINEVMVSGLIEEARKVLADHDSQTINNPFTSVADSGEWPETGPAVQRGSDDFSTQATEGADPRA